MPKSKKVHFPGQICAGGKCCQARDLNLGSSYFLPGQVDTWSGSSLGFCKDFDLGEASADTIGNIGDRVEMVGFVFFLFVTDLTLLHSGTDSGTLDWVQLVTAGPGGEEEVFRCAVGVELDNAEFLQPHDCEVGVLLNEE